MNLIPVTEVPTQKFYCYHHECERDFRPLSNGHSWTYYCTDCNYAAWNGGIKPRKRLPKGMRHILASWLENENHLVLQREITLGG